MLSMVQTILLFYTNTNETMDKCQGVLISEMSWFQGSKCVYTNTNGTMDKCPDYQDTFQGILTVIVNKGVSHQHMPAGRSATVLKVLTTKNFTLTLDLQRYCLWHVTWAFVELLISVYFSIFQYAPALVT